jgi:hypothetical protein
MEESAGPGMADFTVTGDGPLYRLPWQWLRSCERLAVLSTVLQQWKPMSNLITPVRVYDHSEAVTGSIPVAFWLVGGFGLFNRVQ